MERNETSENAGEAAPDKASKRTTSAAEEENDIIKVETSQAVQRVEQNQNTTVDLSDSVERKESGMTDQNDGMEHGGDGVGDQNDDPQQKEDCVAKHIDVAEVKEDCPNSNQIDGAEEEVDSLMTDKVKSGETMRESGEAVIEEEESSDQQKTAAEPDKPENSDKDKDDIIPRTAGVGEDDDGDDDDTSEEYTLEEFGDPASMNLIMRTKVFAKGQEYQQAGNKTMAIKCYLRCLKGLEKTNGFTSLPQCLRNIADIYYSKGEFAKAIQFIQAEKLFYETALIDASQLARQLEEEVDCDSKDFPNDAPQVNPDLVRADEYEKLAKLCLEKKQPPLALEYQAKATKLRQKVLGEDHPVTAESLDFFTVVYAEVGKIQYSESMKKIDNLDLSENQQPLTEELGNESGLRKRAVKEKKEDSTTTEKEEKSGLSPTEQEAIRAEEEWISRSLLKLLFVISFVVVLITGFLLYCRLNPSSTTCRSFKRELQYYYTMLKYNIYYYSSPYKTYG